MTRLEKQMQKNKEDRKVIIEVIERVQERLEMNTNARTYYIQEGTERAVKQLDLDIRRDKMLILNLETEIETLS